MEKECKSCVSFGTALAILYRRYNKKKKRHSQNDYTIYSEIKNPYLAPPKGAFIFGGEQGIRTLETALTVYTISNRAPSASSDNSPNKFILLIAYIL